MKIKKIWNETTNDEEFTNKLISKYFEIQPQLIVNLVPHIIHKISEKEEFMRFSCEFFFSFERGKEFYV